MFGVCQDYLKSLRSPEDADSRFALEADGPNVETHFHAVKHSLKLHLKGQEEDEDKEDDDEDEEEVVEQIEEAEVEEEQEE